MDINHYDRAIEQQQAAPGGLEELRRQVTADPDLSDADKQFLDGKIGTYLADHQREAQASDPEWEPPEEHGASEG